MKEIEIALELLNKICTIDKTVANVMEENKKIKDEVISTMSKSFENIVRDFPSLVEDIQRRIVEYHSLKSKDQKITDFVHLVDWYSMCLADKSNTPEYWDNTGKHYGLRMNEVINFFLIARFNGGLV